ncbi:MAG: hypothetical protein ACI9JN_001279 [Bacteroidia bacterium]|jgi:hypothetical protein
MEKQKAILESERGTATRRTKDLVGNDITIIAYPDGSYYRLVAKHGKALHDLCGAPRTYECQDKTDWEPTTKQ